MIDMRTGAMRVDMDECLFCGDCAVACPLDAVFLDEERELTLICDLCGGEPRCMPVCPKDVIRVTSGTAPDRVAPRSLGTGG
jgi:Fe-S-cluster-containing hydrogenase component 2